MVKCPDCHQEMSSARTTSCTRKSITLGGQMVKRNTRYFDANKRCHDCNIVNRPGNAHHHGCDIERCPIDGQQLISCGHTRGGQMPAAVVKQQPGSGVLEGFFGKF